MRPRDYSLRFVEQVTPSEYCEVARRQQCAVRDVSFHQCGGEYFARKICRLIHIALAASRPATQSERNTVLAENVGQSFEFSNVRSGEYHVLAFRYHLLDFFQHGGNGAVKAGCGLGNECDWRLGFDAAGDAEVFHVGAGQAVEVSLPVLGRDI